MRPSPRPLIIASRQTPLARAQTELVAHALQRVHPKIKIEYRWILSEADQHPDTRLADIGGKGLFTRAVEQAVINHDADIAIHSLKDLPSNDHETGMTQGLTLVAIPPRADARDSLISRHTAPAPGNPGSPGSLQDLPRNGTVATSSPRRAAQVLRIRPDLHIEPLRGSVQTRLKKILDENRFDATLLAVAGLRRLGLDQYTSSVIDPREVLPAACQGALAIQARADDPVTIKRCLPLNHPPTAAIVNAERAILRALDGDCHSSIAVLIEPVPTPVPNQPEPVMRIRVRVLSPNGQTCIEVDEQAPPGPLTKPAQGVIDQLNKAGAQQLLARS